MPIQINPRRLNGRWRAGWALDLHTVYSIPLDNGSFRNEYTEIGKLFHKLKPSEARRMIKLNQEVMYLLILILLCTAFVSLKAFQMKKDTSCYCFIEHKATKPI